MAPNLLFKYLSRFSYGQQLNKYNLISVAEFSTIKVLDQQGRFWQEGYKTDVTPIRNRKISPETRRQIIHYKSQMLVLIAGGCLSGYFV